MSTLTPATILTVELMQYHEDRASAIRVNLRITVMLACLLLFGVEALLVPPGALLFPLCGATLSVLAVTLAAAFRALRAEKERRLQHCGRYGLLLNHPKDALLVISDEDRQAIEDHLGQPVRLQYGQFSVDLQHVTSTTPFAAYLASISRKQRLNLNL